MCTSQIFYFQPQHQSEFPSILESIQSPMKVLPHQIFTIYFKIMFFFSHGNLIQFVDLNCCSAFQYALTSPSGTALLKVRPLDRSHSCLITIHYDLTGLPERSLLLLSQVLT